MAGRKNRPNKKASTLLPSWTQNARPPFEGYLSVSLSADHDKNFDNTLASFGDSLRLLDTTLFDGYTLSVGFDTRNDCWKASLFCYFDPTGESTGYMLTAQESSPTAALLLVLYKHEVVCKGDWTAYLPSDDTPTKSKRR